MKERPKSFKCLSSVALIAGLVIAGWVGDASAIHQAGHKSRVVVHVDLDNPKAVRLALNNVNNILKAAGGSQNVDIQLLVNGPALKKYFTKGANLQVAQRVSSLMFEGVGFGACGNTMKAFKIDKDQVLEGMYVIPEGAVVRAIKLQDQGWAYLKP